MANSPYKRKSAYSGAHLKGRDKNSMRDPKMRALAALTNNLAHLPFHLRPSDDVPDWFTLDNLPSHLVPGIGGK